MIGRTCALAKHFLKAPVISMTYTTSEVCCFTWIVQSNARPSVQKQD